LVLLSLNYQVNMRFQEISEQPVAPAPGIGGAVPMAAPTIGAPPAATPGAPAVPGAATNPQMQAAQLAQQKKQKEDQRKAIQGQIAALQKQLADLSSQQ
jgi:hypothetical protein